MGLFQRRPVPNGPEPKGPAPNGRTPPAPPTVKMADGLAAGPSLRTPTGAGKVGAVRVAPAHVSARGVLKSVTPIPERAAIKGMPVLPMVPRPSLVETMGEAPLPTEEFTAVVAGGFSIARADDATAAGRPTSPVEPPAAEETAPATVHLTVSGVVTDLPVGDSDRLTFPTPGADPVPHGQSQPVSPELARVIHAWPELPAHMQAAILAMVEVGTRR